MKFKNEYCGATFNCLNEVCKGIHPSLLKIHALCLVRLHSDQMKYHKQNRATICSNLQIEFFLIIFHFSTQLKFLKCNFI